LDFIPNLQVIKAMQVRFIMVWLFCSPKSEF
jgi:hypothetical protein